MVNVKKKLFFSKLFLSYIYFVGLVLSSELLAVDDGDLGAGFAALAASGLHLLHRAHPSNRTAEHPVFFPSSHAAFSVHNLSTICLNNNMHFDYFTHLLQVFWNLL